MAPGLTAASQLDLVRLVASNRDRQAFIQLFDYFAPRLNAYLQRLGSPPSLAEDIVQDTMQALWLKADLFDPARSSLATWVYRIARNRRIDLMRRDRLDFYDPLDDGTGLFDTPNPYDASSHAPNPETLLSGWQRESRVRAALTQLPADQGELIRLAFFEDLSHSQIAEATGLPLGTIKSRIRLAFARLRRTLEEAGLSTPD